MKKIYCLLLFLLLFQKAYCQKSLSGEYKIDMNQTLSLMEVEYKRKYDSLESSVRDRAYQSMVDRVFIFKDNGVIEVFWKVKGQEKFTEGTWALNGEEILSIKVNEQTTEYKLSRPTATALILRNSGSKGGFFSNLYLRRLD